MIARGDLHSVSSSEHLDSYRTTGIVCVSQAGLRKCVSSTDGGWLYRRAVFDRRYRGYVEEFLVQVRFRFSSYIVRPTRSFSFQLRVELRACFSHENTEV